MTVALVIFLHEPVQSVASHPRDVKDRNKKLMLLVTDFCKKAFVLKKHRVLSIRPNQIVGTRPLRGYGCPLLDVNNWDRPVGFSVGRRNITLCVPSYNT
ncbi:hypothetical protein J6590_073090 [Homalodisca vitripennis]|nr:hypothetical protein J6590_073090 [Homalodisca vitripennis]